EQVKPGSTSSPSRRVVPLETLRSARYASAARRRGSITQTSLTPAAPVGHLGAHPVARAPPVAHARAPSPCDGMPNARWPRLHASASADHAARHTPTWDE